MCDCSVWMMTKEWRSSSVCVWMYLCDEGLLTARGKLVVWIPTVLSSLFRIMLICRLDVTKNVVWCWAKVVCWVKLSTTVTKWVLIWKTTDAIRIVQGAQSLYQCLVDEVGFVGWATRVSRWQCGLIEQHLMPQDFCRVHRHCTTWKSRWRSGFRWIGPHRSRVDVVGWLDWITWQCGSDVELIRLYHD